MAKFFGIACAVAMHVGFILFGGLLLGSGKEDEGTLQEVELLSVDDAAAEKKKEETEEQDTETEEEIDAEAEPPPDAAEIIRNLELASVVDAPALEAASLSAIELALSGQTGSGDFADVLSLSGGGRIGGMGKAGALDQELENAFSLAEIDQQPRAVFQASPLYPAEMRGKKLEGVVTVIFVVDESGKVINPRVAKSTHPAFERPALDAVKQWKFEPAVKAGQRVGCKTRVTIRFEPS